MSDIKLLPYGSEDPNDSFVAWTPIPLVIQRQAAVQGQKLRLSSKSLQGAVTKIVFRSTLDEEPSEEIIIDFEDVLTKTIFICGDFQAGEKHNGASRDSKDVAIEAVSLDSPAVVVGSVDVMIRVRKNANELSDKAREDFLFALAKLNGIKVDGEPVPGAGFGIYVTDFVDAHVNGASRSEHGDAHFLPWHRLYCLDLERLLQEINPAITLPYWRFDEPAPNLFHMDFLGQTAEIPRDTRLPNGTVQTEGAGIQLARFSSLNPLSRWQIKNTNGIRRTARFDTKHQPANGFISLDNTGGVFDFQVISQTSTLALGGSALNPTDIQLGSIVNGRMTHFIQMEGTPHGAAHMSFNGPINNVPVAPKDPLFFLLHCNIDRLWALWQYAFERDDKTQTSSYPYQSINSAERWKVVSSTQWPWDNSLSVPNRLRAPGTRANNFKRSTLVKNFNSNSPAIENTIDAFGRLNLDDDLGYAYDDVPYTR